MPFCKPIILIVFLLCFSLVSYVYAQATTIIPKPQPVTLLLDGTGYYKVNPVDIANITSNTDSTARIKATPSSFNCSNTGPNVVALIAYDNGTTGTLKPQGAHFNGPVSIAFDPTGNMYVSEEFGSYVRKITPQGKVTKFVGNGTLGHADGVGANAIFGSPQGITADTLGNLYLLDAGSPVLGAYPSIRKITQAGVVTTLYTGNVFVNPFGIAIDKKGVLYITDLQTNNVYTFKPGVDSFPLTLAGAGYPGYIDGPKDKAQFNKPAGIAIDDAGNVYVTENPNNALRKIAPDGMVSTFAGTGHSKGLDDPDINTFLVPYDVKISKSGYIYISDYQHIIRISPDGKNKIVFCANPGLNGVMMAFDECENIYLTTVNQNRIDKVSTAGVYSVFAGTQSAEDVDGDIGPFSCQITAQNVNVQVQSQPLFTTIFNDVTVTECASLPDYTIKAKTIDNCANSTIKITQTPDPNIELLNNKTVNVTLTATDYTGGTVNQSFNVTAKYTSAPPGRSVSVAASATEICEGTAVTFKATVVNVDAGTTYQWLVNGVLTGPDGPEFTTSNLNDGDLVNCVATTGGGCGIPNTGLDVKMRVGPYPSVSLKASEQILAGNSIQFKPLVTGNIVSYLWTPATGLSDPIAANPIATPTVTTTYQLKVLTDLGCAAGASVTVGVTNQIKVPNTFTPNGDGVNDVWEIKYLSIFTSCSVSIYDRYGSLVFHSAGYGKPWNGTYNGKPVAPGEYYYLIDLKDGSALQSGGLTVLR